MQRLYLPLALIGVLLLGCSTAVLLVERHRILHGSKHTTLTIRWDPEKVQGIGLDSTAFAHRQGVIIGGFFHSHVGDGDMTVAAVINSVVDIGLTKHGVVERRVSISPGDHTVIDMR